MASVMVMLLMEMGVVSLLLTVTAAGVFVWGNLVLVCGPAGLSTAASRVILPALGGVWAAISAQTKVDNKNRYEFFIG